MSAGAGQSKLSGLHLRLPATSANLGPGFDALGLAMSFYLTVDAIVSTNGEFAIQATGRDQEVCGRLSGNLILDTYCDVTKAAGREPVPLNLLLHNEIPLGMGCGSSAAALLAGTLLANHFGELGWTGYRAMEEACWREGHPDNVAACWAGGMTASAMEQKVGGRAIVLASCGQECGWGIMLVIPSTGLATKKARALLPETYSKADVVANVQHTALLVAAFALGRSDLLSSAMADRLHQPYRAEACPLLPVLLPMVNVVPGVLGVALSGAGPAVLILFDRLRTVEVRAAVLEKAAKVEIIVTETSKGTSVLVT